MEGNISDTGPLKGRHVFSSEQRTSKKKSSEESSSVTSAEDQVELSPEATKKAEEAKKVSEWVRMLEEMPSTREGEVARVQGEAKSYGDVELKEVSKAIEKELFSDD